MPFKFHEPGRHRVPTARYRVTNWPEYDRGVVGRGDLRLWIADDAIAAWAAPRRRTRGGQARFSDLAIETVLVLAGVFPLPLGQAEGFARSILAVMDLDLPVPDHTTLPRRRRGVPVEMNAPGRQGPVDLVLDSTGLTFHGPGEWDRLKHGEKRRAWRKLHLAVDAGTGEILAPALTDGETADAAIRAARPPRSPPAIVVPPSAPSIPTRSVAHGGTERERHAAAIAAHGRMAWQKAHGYGLRSLGETAISQLKARGGGRLTARSFRAQRKEVALRISIANKAIRHAKPVTVRIA